MSIAHSPPKFLFVLGRSHPPIKPTICEKTRSPGAPWLPTAGRQCQIPAEGALIKRALLR